MRRRVEVAGVLFSFVADMVTLGALLIAAAHGDAAWAVVFGVFLILSALERRA